MSPHRESQTTGDLSSRRGASVFVGRERELRELEAGLEDALSGRGRLFLVGGEPGIGKSRLADELATVARGRGARVLWGRCWEAGGAPAYWPWVQSVRSYFRDHDPDTLVAQIGDGGSDLVQVFPELRELIPDLPPPHPLDPEGARFRFFDSMSRFLQTASRAQPLVLVLDDLHAADKPSLILLRFLAGELAESHVLVIGAFRDGELERGNPLTETLAGLAREQMTRIIRLRGLSQADVARFIEATAAVDPSASLVLSVFDETEGNPLFVDEVIGLLTAEGQLDAPVGTATIRISIPPRIREVIGRRLDHHSRACIHILTLASVWGREFDLEGLERTSGLSAVELLAVIDEAVAAGLVAEVPGVMGRLRFSHALVRDVLYDELPGLERVQLHEQVGEVLEALYGDDAEPHLSELAHHFVEAARGGDVEKAVEYARRAGDRAVSSLAYEEAVRLYELAFQGMGSMGAAVDDSRCELLLAMGDAQTRAGETDGAKRSLLRAAAIAKKRNMPERLARAALGYGGRFVWPRSGDDDDLVPLLQDALTALGEGDSPLRVKLLARLAGAIRDQPSKEPRATLSREAVEIARRIGDPATLAYALDGRYSATWWPENAKERLAIASEMIHLADEAGDKERAAQGYDYRFCALMELGDVAAVDAELGALARLAEELRQPAQRWLATTNRAMRALLDGAFDEAEELIQEAWRIGQVVQAWDARVLFAVQTFVLRREQARLVEVEATIKRAVEEYPTRPMFRCILADLYSELGRMPETRRIFEDLCANDFARMPSSSNDWLFGMMFLAEVAGSLDDTRRAAALYPLLLPYAGSTAPYAGEVSVGSLSRYAGILATTLSRFEEAECHFEAALDMNTKMGARPWIAHTQHDYARMLLTRDLPGDHEKASLLLADAMETCRALGMVSLTTKVSSLLEGREVSERHDGRPGSTSSSDLSASVFRREGEYWSIAYEQDAFRLRDSKGLRYIAYLLGDPGREFHVLDLVRRVGEGEPERPAPRGTRAEPELEIRALEEGDSILDTRAKAAFRRRLVELEEELDEAQAFGDPERASRAKEERDFLARELSSALGLGGRDRKSAAAAERARINVTKAIKAALSRIRENSPSLGRHLDSTIRTGTFCSYVPDPRLPIPWRL